MFFATKNHFTHISEAERQEQINKASGEAQAMLAIAEARAKGLELVARPLKTKVTLLSIALSFVIVICTVFTTHNHTVCFISTVLLSLILKPPATPFSRFEPFHLLLIDDDLKIFPSYS